MIISLIASLLVLAQPYLTKLAIDEGLIAGNFNKLIIYILAILAVAIASQFLSGLNRHWHISLSGKILFAIREAVYRHLQLLSPSFYAKYRTGDLLSRLDGDVAEVQRFALDGLLAAFSSTLGLLGALSLLFWLDSQLAVLALVLLPLEFAYLRMMRPLVERKTLQLRERSGDISAFLVETTSQMKFVQTVAAESIEFCKLKNLNNDYLKSLLSLQITEFATSAVPNLMTVAARAFVFVVGGYKVIQGELALGALIAFLSYLTMVVGPINTLLGMYVALKRAAVSLGRIRELTQTPEWVVQDKGNNNISPSQPGEIEFTELSFQYPRSRTAIIENSSCFLPAGCKVGIHGPSGIGKSTLVDLLLRHLEPTSGVIRIDGKNLNDYKLSAWRRAIGVVSQDLVLFRGTLLENLLYANSGATKDNIEEVIERCQLEPLIRQLPNGLNTILGERGTQLSGGERQRIAIARVVLQQPLIIVFDEATSAVEAALEKTLIDTMDRLFADKTRLIISHRDLPLAETDYLLTISERKMVLRKRWETCAVAR